MKTRSRLAPPRIAGLIAGVVAGAVAGATSAQQDPLVDFEMNSITTAQALENFAEPNGSAPQPTGTFDQDHQSSRIDASPEPARAIDTLPAGGDLVHQPEEPINAPVDGNRGAAQVRPIRQRRLLASVAGYDASMSAQPASQSESAASKNTDTGEEIEQQPDERIVVTGSRIQRSAATTPTPATIMDRTMLEANADARIAQTLNQLPSLGSTQTPSNTNFNPEEAGTNFLDLRRLGIDRTLVLVDGRRFVGSRPGSAAVDTNMIPAALIERVEIITGGASAVYGADAVSGVVNLIMRDRFEGLEINGQFGQSDEGDGETWQVSITGGGSFDNRRGHAFFSVTHDENEDINGSDRAWFAQSLRFASNPADTGPSDGIPGQILFGNTGFSATPPGGRVIGPDGQLFESAGGPFTFDASGNLVPQDLGNVLESFLQQGGDTADLAQFDQLLVPVERTVVSGGIDYELHEKVNLFVRGSFAQARSSTFGQPTFSLPSVEPMFIQADNPFVPDALRDLLAEEELEGFFVGRTNVDQGARRSKADRDTVQLYVGFEGDLTPNIDYTVHYQYGRSDNSTEFINEQVPSRFQQALDAIEDPETGEVVCRDPSGGCVPLNVLGPNTATEEALGFVHTDFTTRGKLEQQVFNLTFTGNSAGFFEPFDGAVGFAAGFEYRDESASTNEGFLRTTGDFFASPPIGNVAGSFDVWEVFGEVSVPILEDRPFAHSLNVDAAVRYGDYSTIGSTTAWKIGGDWAPTTDLRFRGAFSVAVRAPNIGELFGPTDVLNIFLEDPCDAANLDSGSQFRRDNCAALGLPADFESQSLNRTNTVITGGNPDLLEEEADTVTFGAVFTPRWIPGLTLAVDYWDIDITDAINSFPAQTLVRNCVDAETIDNPFCEQIVRQPNGNFDIIESRLINVAAFRASGIDFDVAYNLDLARLSNDRMPGLLDLRMVATYLDRLDFFGQEETEIPDQNAGELGDPEFSMNLRVSYRLGKWNISMEERFFSSQKFDLGESSEARSPNSTGRKWYTDLQLRYDLRDNTSVFLGVDNLFDNDPPRLARIPEIRSFAGDATVFDQIGRFIRVGASIRF